MVTVRNDIESLSNGTGQPKDVNRELRAKAKAKKRKSYRCVTIVALAVLFMLTLAIGTILFYEYIVGRLPINGKTDGDAVTSVPTQQVPTLPVIPELTDPYQQTSPSNDLADLTVNNGRRSAVDYDDRVSEVIFIDSAESGDHEKVPDSNGSSEMHRTGGGMGDSNGWSGSGSGDDSWDGSGSGSGDGM